MNVAFTILVVLIVLAAILLIVVVLLQNGKDGGLATNFTSANQALGVRQTATILEKATWYLIAFILVLSIISVFTLRSGSVKSTNDSVSTEILNDAAGAASEAPAFPVDIPQTDPTAAQPATDQPATDQPAAQPSAETN
ncbi:MAG: preprotein translocase subunit SecG [Bacteroidales bacterium]|nr:preprotein translocase subunit SecG [Bacteroidales bacterium]